MGKKRSTRCNTHHKQRIFEADLEQVNIRAIKEGPKRKTWSPHDIKSVRPLTPNQEDMFHAWFNDMNICAHGSAGSGKTYLGLYLALNEILDQNRDQSRIILVRSAVSTRDLGFMPGGLDEKMAYYETPYHAVLQELVGRPSTYRDMKDAGLIEFMTTSFIRGLTWDNAVVVVDEGQNMSFHEISSILTRIGKNTRLIFLGDTMQTDLTKSSRDQSGMGKMLSVIDKMSDFTTINFTHDDIVRSDFVKRWIVACETCVA